MSGEAPLPVLPTLGYAILALLAREPLTGYEISQQLRDPIGLFWQAVHSQVYPVLTRIEAFGLARSTTEPGPGPRPKKRYQVTDRGLDALRAWVESPQERRGRDELLLRVYASWVAGTDATVALLEEAEAHHARQLATYLARRSALLERGGPAGPGTAEFADYATLRRGIGYERGRLAWIHWLMGQIDTHKRAQPRPSIGVMKRRRPSTRTQVT